MASKFPDNPTDGMLFEVAPNIYYQYTASDKSWSKIYTVDELELATAENNGLMSSSDYLKLLNLKLPPPQSTLQPVRTTTRTDVNGNTYLFDTPLCKKFTAPVKLDSGDKFVVVDAATENTHGATSVINFDIDTDELVKYLQAKGQWVSISPKGDKGETGDQGAPGMDALPVGPYGEDGKDGAPYWDGSLVEESILVKTDGTKAIVNIKTQEVSKDENYIIIERGIIGNPLACPNKILPKDIQSPWLLALGPAITSTNSTVYTTEDILITESIALADYSAGPFFHTDISYVVKPHSKVYLYTTAQSGILVGDKITITVDGDIFEHNFNPSCVDLSSTTVGASYISSPHDISSLFVNNSDGDITVTVTVDLTALCGHKTSTDIYLRQTYPSAVITNSSSTEFTSGPVGDVASEYSPSRECGINPDGSCGNMLYYFNIESIIQDIFDEWQRQLLVIKQTKEAQVYSWLTTMSTLFEQQKAALCCALEAINSRKRNQDTRRYIESQSIAALAANRTVVIRDPASGDNTLPTEYTLYPLSNSDCPNPPNTQMQFKANAPSTTKSNITAKVTALGKNSPGMTDLCGDYGNGAIFDGATNIVILLQKPSSVVGPNYIMRLSYCKSDKKWAAYITNSAITGGFGNDYINTDCSLIGQEVNLTYDEATGSVFGKFTLDGSLGIYNGATIEIQI